MTIAQDNYKKRYARDREAFVQRAREYRERKRSGTYVNLRELHLQQRQAQIDALTDIELAYIAGIIDGEGTVSISSNKSALRNGVCPVQYNGRITVVNTSVSLLDWLNTRIGGAQMRTRKTKPEYKDVYVLIVNGCASAMLCKRLLPYLVVKKKQAELVIELYANGYKRNAYRVTEEEFLRRHSIWERYSVSY